MTNKEKYLQKIAGKKSNTIIEAEWRIKYRDLIKEHNKLELQLLIAKDEFKKELDSSIKDNDLVFKYILFKYTSWADEIGDDSSNNMSSLKFLNLVFLLSTTNPEYYYKLGFRFKAYPSGAFETSLYTALKPSKTLDNVIIKNHFSELCAEIKLNIDRSVDTLKTSNFYLIKYSASKLVDIIHKYSCWIVPYNCAIRQGKNCADIPLELMNCENFYYA